MSVTRASNPSLKLAQDARKLVAPFGPEIGRLNEQAARIAAARIRPQLTEEEGRALLLRAAEIEAQLLRIEGQLAAALVGQSSEIVGHGRVQDLRLAIVAIRGRLNESRG